VALLTLRQIRRYIKPPVFLASALPLVWLLAGALGIAGVWLGANPVKTIQHTTGLWALRFLMLTLLCTPLRWVTGQAWPIHFRRMMGLYAFSYAALHFSNYLLLDRALDLGEILADISKRPYITIGFSAVVLMLPLAITSTAGWRRRLGARWQTLHRAVYAISILACWHFYWQVKKDIREPLLYCTILAVLLGYRLWRARRERVQAQASAVAG
jgi:sulfoxide reductase heme-binding subunit YedZ